MRDHEKKTRELLKLRMAQRASHKQVGLTPKPQIRQPSLDDLPMAEKKVGGKNKLRQFGGAGDIAFGDFHESIRSRDSMSIKEFPLVLPEPKKKN